MPAAANADPATNIVSTSADLNGTIAGADPGDQYQFSFGTTPGGPYPTFPILQPAPSPAADGPVTQNTGNQLSPNTTYYYVVTTYDSLNNVIAVSNEQSFTTLSVSIESCNDVNCQCATCLIAGETSAVTCLVAYGNTNTNWYYVQRWGTTPGGPYPNTSVPPNLNFAQGTDPDGDVSYQPPGTFPSGTQIYYVWEMYDDNNVLQDTSPECTFNTVQPYSVACDPATNITQTSADLQGTITDMPSSIAYQFIWGTTPGGPYPNATGLLPGPGPGANPVFQNIAGLTPNTTYYYKVESRVGTNNVEKQSTECQFTTQAIGPPPRTATGAPATNITQTTADLNGTVGGIQPGDTYEFNVGPSGGPYTTVVGPFPAANGPVTAPIAGLTPNTQYCYLVVVKDNTTATQATSAPEVCFTTAAIGSFNPECNPAVLDSATSANLQGTVDNMDPLHKARIEVGTAPGGPYATFQSGDTFGNNTVNQPIPPVLFNVSGLTAGTTYYYRTAVYDNGNVFVEASTECSFTTPNPSIICGTVTNITDFSADFNATALESDAPPGYIYTVEVATVSGGPYTALPGATNNDGTDPDVFTASKTGLNASTTYFYRYKIFDNLNTLVYTSPECGSFMTQPAGAPQCTPATAITANSATLNGIITGASPGDTYEFQYGTTNGGPYGTTVGPFPAANGPVSQPIAGLTPNTTYYYVVVQRNAGAAIEGTSTQCQFTTSALPPTVTTDPPTNQNADCITLNGTSTNAVAGQCTYSFIWGTTPGGPYPNVVNGTPFVATGASPEAFSATVCGLGPNKQIYYKARVQCAGPNPPVIGDEVPANTLAILFDPCEPATDITPFSATLHATATNVPAGFTYRFRYGTTPGGPYPFAVPAGAATGASPESWQAPVAGLTPCTTYYYTSEVLNAQQQVVAGAGECSFTSECAEGPAGFVYWCGALFDSADCIFVPDNVGSYYGDDNVPDGYYNCWPADVRDNFGPGYGPEGQ